VRELASLERMSAAAMSGYVDRLERAGFMQRTPDTTDRRRHGLSLTPVGVRVLRSIRSRRTAWLAARLRHLSPAELETIDRAIDPLLSLLEEKQ